MIGLKNRREAPMLLAVALALSAVGFTTAGCASDKCASATVIQASISGRTVSFGGCGGGNFGVPVAGRQAALTALEERPLTLRVGEKATFTYLAPAGGYPYGAGVSDPGVLGLVSAPPSGTTLGVVVGVAPGTALFTIEPTAYCGDTEDRCALTAVQVVAK